TSVAPRTAWWPRGSRSPRRSGATPTTRCSPSTSAHRAAGTSSSGATGCAWTRPTTRRKSSPPTATVATTGPGPSRWRSSNDRDARGLDHDRPFNVRSLGRYRRWIGGRRCRVRAPARPRGPESRTDRPERGGTGGDRRGGASPRYRGPHLVQDLLAEDAVANIAARTADLEVGLLVVNAGANTYAHEFVPGDLDPFR